MMSQIITSECYVNITFSLGCTVMECRKFRNCIRLADETGCSQPCSVQLGILPSTEIPQPLRENGYSEYYSHCVFHLELRTGAQCHLILHLQEKNDFVSSITPGRQLKISSLLALFFVNGPLGSLHILCASSFSFIAASICSSIEMPPAGKCIPLQHHEQKEVIISFDPLANATDYMDGLYTDAVHTFMKREYFNNFSRESTH